MEKLSRNFCLGENSCNNSQSIEKYLQNWKLPPSSASDIYKRNGILNYSLRFKLKTVEEEIPLSDGYASFNLFSDDLKLTYRKFDYLHLGRVEVALKPTKLDSNKSATICLRNNTTILSMVESSLSDGPIYFSHFYSTSQFDFTLSDPDLATSLTLDIKIDGSKSTEEEKVVILMLRFHYNVMKGCQFIRSKNYHFVEESGRTTLYVTKVAQNNRVVSRKIIWDRVLVPERWLVENNAAFSKEQPRGDARLDWKEAADAHVLKVDVPGFGEEEVKVETAASGGILQISGERREERGEEGDKWHCVERGGGMFLRRFKLPENANLEELTMGLEKGVLTVTVPKINQVFG